MKRGFVFLFLAVFLLFMVSASSIDSEISRITYYAQEYETGNIDYVKLLVYLSSVREKMNEKLGATEKEVGGVLKEEKIREVLGEPAETTNWVWLENEQHEIRFDRDVPIWRKLVFDGKKIQIRLSAYPSLYIKENKEILIYRIHPEINFKKSKEEMNIQEKISEIKNLAENFNSNPARENAELLAEKSVNAEKNFESFLRQNVDKCEDIMKSVFGSENKRREEKLLVQEIIFYNGYNFNVIARLELCEECEWHYANLDFWFEGRGRFRMPKEETIEMPSVESYMYMGFDDFKQAIRKELDLIKQLIEKGDYSTALNVRSRIKVLGWAWDRKANDVWQEVEKIFELDRASATPKQLEKYDWIKEEQAKRKKVEEIRKRNYDERRRFYMDLFSGYNRREYYFTQIEFENRLVEVFMERGEEICDNNIDDNNNSKVDCMDEQCGGKLCGKQKVLIEEGNETKEVEKELFCIEKVCKLKEEIIEERKAICGNHVCDGNETKENCAEDCALCPDFPALECRGKVVFKGKDEKGCFLEPICIEENKTCEKNEDCGNPLCGKAECIEKECRVTELGECNETECLDGEAKMKKCSTGEEIIEAMCVNGVWSYLDIECPRKEKVCCKVGQKYEWKTQEECSTENYDIVDDVFCKEKEMTCELYCPTLIYPACVGELKISGTYPNCNCEWICKIEPIGDECKVKEDCGNENDVCSNGKCVTIPEKIEPAPEFPPTEPIPEPQPAPEIPVEPITEPIPITEPTPAPEPQPALETQPEPAPETTTTGQLIKTLKIITGKITGFITGLQTEEPAPEPITEPTPTPEPTPAPETTPEPQPEPSPEPQPAPEMPEEKTEEPKQEEREEWEERETEEKQERCKEDCKRGCYDNIIVPCADSCIRKECGERFECVIEEERKKCEETCNKEKDINSCINRCLEKCMKGEKFWEEFEKERPKEEHKEEKTVFKVGGTCRSSASREEAFIFFDGWGNPFEQIQRFKHKYYTGGEAEWCKEDFENLKKQRKEFENGFNQEFVKWFFEGHLANSAQDWESYISGIFELYWRDIDNSRQMVERMSCLDIKSLPEHQLINVKYETSYGSLEFWEEVKKVKLEGMEYETEIISPYMKIWIFPPKSFIAYEMKEAMKNHEFPGPPEEKMERVREEGPTDEEKEMIKKDKKVMAKIREISLRYGGSLEGSIQFKDYEKNEIVFNLYGYLNEEDILKIKPMLPEEMPREIDVRAEIDFEKLYDLIYSMEKEMQGIHIENPPWDKRIMPIQKIKEVVNGVKAWFKMRALIDSAKFYPPEAEKEMKNLFKTFFSMMARKEIKRGIGVEEEEELGEEKGVWESKEKITGEVIA